MAINREAADAIGASDPLAPALQQFSDLSADDQLGLLWFIYDNMGSSVTPAAPGAAEAQMTTRLFEQVKGMDPEAQLDFMRDLINHASTPQTQEYAKFTKDNKLVFWYELAEGMRTGEVVPVPDDYQLPAGAAKVLKDVVSLEFNQQITLLRHAVVGMGPAS